MTRAAFGLETQASALKGGSRRLSRAWSSPSSVRARRAIDSPCRRARPEAARLADSIRAADGDVPAELAGYFDDVLLVGSTRCNVAARSRPRAALLASADKERDVALRPFAIGLQAASWWSASVVRHLHRCATSTA